MVAALGWSLLREAIAHFVCNLRGGTGRRVKRGFRSNPWGWPRGSRWLVPPLLFCAHTTGGPGSFAHPKQQAGTCRKVFT